MRTPKATRPLAFIFIVLVSQSVAKIDDGGRRGFPQAKPHSGSNHRVLTSSSGTKSKVKVKAFQHLLNYLLALCRRSLKLLLSKRGPTYNVRWTLVIHIA